VAVVRTVYSVRLVHVAVCGSVPGSVWQCTQDCADVRHCSSVRQYSSVGRSLLQSVCGSMAVCGRAAVCGSVRQCGSVNGSAGDSARSSVRQCAW
jgi:hypothetical protein